MKFRICWGLLGIWPILLVAADPSTPSPLPQPLTLRAALALADEDHPDLLVARAELDAGEAAVKAAQARDDPTVRLFGRARWVDPPSGSEFNQENQDHSLSLRVRKPLYDFGRTASGDAAARAERDAKAALLLDARQQRHIEIIEAFLNVLLADLTYARDNELVSSRYVRFTRLGDRHELGQLSDVELLEAESRYQAARVDRARSEVARRASRSRLAMKLNRPGDLPSDLLPPELPGNNRAIPDLASLEAKALSSNEALHAARALVTALSNRTDEAKAQGRPIISGELEAATYTRELSSRDSFRAGIHLEMPLYLGDRIPAEIAQRRAELAKARAKVTRLEWALRQQVLDRVLELESLYVQREEASVRAASSELSLDQRLALRDLEREADLGDTLIESSSAILHKTRTEYEIALTWAGLDALIGLTPEEIVRNALGETNE